MRRPLLTWARSLPAPPLSPSFLEHIHILLFHFYWVTWLIWFWHIRNETFPSGRGAVLEESAKARKEALVCDGGGMTGMSTISVNNSCSTFRFHVDPEPA